MTTRARSSRPIGLRAEAVAESYLVSQGFLVLARNHHCRQGELDLVVARRDLVVFVEVKARKAGAIVEPLESVTRSKQRKLVLAALDFAQTAAIGDRAMRFDVIAITLPRKGTSETPVIEHVENAFDASAADDFEDGRR